MAVRRRVAEPADVARAYPQLRNRRALAVKNMVAWPRLVLAGACAGRRRAGAVRQARVLRMSPDSDALRVTTTAGAHLASRVVPRRAWTNAIPRCPDAASAASRSLLCLQWPIAPRPHRDQRSRCYIVPRLTARVSSGDSGRCRVRPRPRRAFSGCGARRAIFCRSEGQPP